MQPLKYKAASLLYVLSLSFNAEGKYCIHVNNSIFVQTLKNGELVSTILLPTNNITCLLGDVCKLFESLKLDVIS